MFYVRQICCSLFPLFEGGGGGHVRSLLRYAVISVLSILRESSLATNWFLFSTRSIILVGAKTCQLFENDFMATCERSRVSSSDLKARIRSAEHFHFERYSKKRELI